MAIAREGRKERARTEKGKGKAGNIFMLGQRQGMPRWADDPVRRHNGHRWRGCQGRKRLPPPEGNWEVGREGGAGQ